MIKLLIADDEAVTRKGIQSSIEWSLYGVDIVGEAKNGGEALEKALALKPDIILTDIRMPVMDGLTLSEQIKEKLPNVRIIILSGYEDLNYVKHALKIGVDDYLLKPFGAEELVNLICKLKKKINDEHRRQEDYIRAQSIMEENLRLIQAKVVQALLKETYEDYAYILEKARLVQLNLINPLYQVVVFTIDDQDFIMEDLPFKEMNYIKNAALSIATEILQEHMNGLFCISDLDYFVGIINAEDNSSMDISDICEEIKNAIQKHLKITITMGLGNTYRYIGAIPSSYQEALLALRQKIYRGKNTIIHVKDITDAEMPPTLYPVDEEKLLLKSLRAADGKNIDDILSLTFSVFKKTRISEDEVKNYCTKLAFMCINTLEEMGLNIKNQLGKNLNLYTEIKKYETIDDMEQWLKGLLKKLVQNLGTFKIQKYKQIINTCIEYISVHYSENITLKALSEIVYVTPNYLSRVFKEETGENFVEWLNKFRIEKAKDLLKDYSYRTYEIAEKVGYSDYKYFSYIFKKYTGKSAQQYLNDISNEQ